MPDDLEFLSTECEGRSKKQRIMAAIFLAALAGIITLTLRLPAILRQKPPMPALLWSALAMFVLALVIGGVFLWFVADKLKRTTGEYRRVQDIVTSATGVHTQAPAPPSRGEQRRLVALLAALPILAIIIFAVVRWLFPNAPSWLPVAFIWVAGGIFAVLNYRKANRQAQPRLRRVALWRVLLNFSLWFALFILVTRFDPRWLSPYVSAKTFLILIMSLCLALPFIFWVFGFLPLWWIVRALVRADYPKALQRANFLLRINPNDAGYLFFRGTVLLFAGRYPEAEQGLRESAEAGDVASMYSQSATLANIGEAVMLQGRYEEAIRTYEAAAQIHPGWGRAFSGMAEAYLWRDIEPERALTLIDRGLERKLGSWLRRHFDRHVLAQMFADRAWALALPGRAEECRAELAKAFRAAGRRFRPGLAGVHYRAGRASLALRDSAQAREHFRLARQLDPGSSGMQAEQMLNREL